MKDITPRERATMELERSPRTEDGSRDASIVRTPRNRGCAQRRLRLRSYRQHTHYGSIRDRFYDFIFGRDDEQVFAVLAVGDFVGLGSHLIAVPFRSLKLDDPSGSIKLPGASRAALQRLPVFLYDR
jgi:hypothetical protein